MPPIKKINGRLGYTMDKVTKEWHRVYDLFEKCKNCGPDVRAMNGRDICHDCNSEAECAYLPPPEEIEAGLREIQKDWTEDEHYSRAGLTREPLVFVEMSHRKLVGER